MLREQVAHLHTELARRYAGKPQPAVDRELEAADQAIALWQALWEQYSACLKPLLEGDPELAGVKAKLLQRGLCVGKQLLLVHGLARRVAAARALAGAARVLPAGRNPRVRGHRGVGRPDAATRSASPAIRPTATRCCSGLADPCAMTVRQIELTDRWLAHVGAQDLSRTRSSARPKAR